MCLGLTSLSNGLAVEPFKIGKKETQRSTSMQCIGSAQGVNLIETANKHSSLLFRLVFDHS